MVNVPLTEQILAVELSTMSLRSQIEMMEVRLANGKPWPAEDLERRKKQLEAERAALETLRALERRNA